jgi:hypothetical protein
MTIRTYELSGFRPCEICAENRECSIPFGGVALDLCVEGGSRVPFAVCESCVRNMTKPFAAGKIATDTEARPICLQLGKTYMANSNDFFIVTELSGDIVFGRIRLDGSGRWRDWQIEGPGCSKYIRELTRDERARLKAVLP